MSLHLSLILLHDPSSAEVGDGTVAVVLVPPGSVLCAVLAASPRLERGWLGRGAFVGANWAPRSPPSRPQSRSFGFGFGRGRGSLPPFQHHLDETAFSF